jgi:hypothetical protein
LAAIHALAPRTKSLAEVPAIGLKIQVDYGQKVTFIKEIQLVMRSPLNDVGTAVVCSNSSFSSQISGGAPIRSGCCSISADCLLIGYDFYRSVIVVSAMQNAER